MEEREYGFLSYLGSAIQRMPLLACLYLLLLLVLDKIFFISSLFSANKEQLREWYPVSYQWLFLLLHYHTAILSGLVYLSLLSVKRIPIEIKNVSWRFFLIALATSCTICALSVPLLGWKIWIATPGLLIALYLWLIKIKGSVWFKYLERKLSKLGSSLIFKNYKSFLIAFVFILLVITGISIGVYYWAEFIIGNNETQFQTVQLLLSRYFLLSVLCVFLIILILNQRGLIIFIRKLMTTADSPYNLAVFRIVVGFQIFGLYLHQLNHNLSWGAMPDSMRVSLPFMGWFIQLVPITPDLFKTSIILGLAIALLITFGLFTRLALLLNIPLSIYVLGVPMFFGKLFHMHIWVWFPAILAFSSCSDVLSIDALIRKKGGEELVSFKHPKYRIPLLFIWLHFGIIYFFAGVVKLYESGWSWALGENMVNQMYLEWVQWYGKEPFFRIDRYPMLLHAGGVATILFEILIPFLVLLPVGRLFVFVGGLIMHNLINAFMYISFSDLQTTYAALLDWRKIFSKIKQVPAEVLPEPKQNLNTLIRLPAYRNVLVIGSLFLITNFLFGAFRIHSWPFSSYPTYSATASNVYHYVFFEAEDINGKSIDVYSEGEKVGFRMESFTPLEDRVFEAMQVGDTLRQIEYAARLWKIWLNNVSALASVDSVRVYMRESPVHPDKKSKVLSHKYLTTFRRDDFK